MHISDKKKAICTRARTHARTHTHTHTQPFYGSLEFVWDNPGEPVPEETLTHSHSSICKLVFNMQIGSKLLFTENTIWIYWSKIQWMAVALARPHANVHLAPGR